MLCMIAKLDDDATETLAALRRAVPGGPRRPLYGHITIAAYTGEDEAAFLRGGRELLAGLSAFSAEIRKLEVLEETSILVASPEKTGALDVLHRRIAARFGDALDRWTRDESWRPHVTLLYDPRADLKELCRRLSAAFTPFSARVRAVEFSRVLDEGYEIVDRVILSD